MHQPWLLHSSECHQLARWRLDPVLLLHLDQLRHLSSYQRPASPIKDLVPRKVWTVHQCRGTRVLDTSVVLRVLAVGKACYTAEHELGLDYVWWGDNYCACVLFCQGETWEVYLTCGPCEEGVLT